MPVVFLSEEDKNILDRVISSVKNGTVNSPRRASINPPETDHQSPEVYVAKTPVGGIAARVGDVISSELCEIYANVNGTLKEVINSSQKVYNLQDSDLDGEIYVNIKRDKYGQWYADSGGGGGASVIMFEIIDSEECGTGCVDASVELLACGFSGLTVGDEITVKDEAGCFFNVDPVFLLGVKGFAVKMDGDDDCTPYNVEACHWVVISLCCALGGCP